MKSARRSTPDLSGAMWHSSTHSGGNNECVEVAGNIPGTVPVRDSKRPGGPVICFSRSAWGAFLDQLR
ncbi:DUF397 domain-containing protein [Streptomyces sp. WAC 00631]|uniref:DUF397 domain-containing protein n=1 Tax=Streptomyces sp. WAC 00631 TaxID=2203201 RepID=UPI000F76692E|nr:DUF397 domain-containing protein [Streptomyces sp. WAC 00631]MCC5035505.1 DUF397 domain-containing protein [Streptomyces sp. WAC 00631]